MAAPGKEFHCKPLEYAVDSPDVDEAEEVLSLSDVPIHGSAVDCDSIPSSSSSSSSSDQDLFEFSSAEELSPSSPEAENIIFCGKLIAPRSGANHRVPQNHEKERIEKIATHFKWISAARSTPDPKSNNDYYPRGEDQKPLSRSRTSPTSASIRRAQLKSSTISRRRPSLWFGFGVARAPVEMDLGDIKRRQVRRDQSAVMHRPSGYDGEEVSVCRKRDYGGGLWGLVKGLGCGGIGSTAVNATLRVVSRV